MIGKRKQYISETIRNHKLKQRKTRLHILYVGLISAISLTALIFNIREYIFAAVGIVVSILLAYILQKIYRTPI